MKTNPKEIDADRAPATGADYPHFAPGTKVRDSFGKEHVVIEQVGCAVFVKGGKHFHPTKVFVAD